MSTIHRLRRPAQLGAVALALALPATAQADELDVEAYYMSQPAGASVPQEEYMASYGKPEPLAPASSGDDLPWLPIALSITGAAAVATGVRRVRRVRRPLPTATVSS